MGFYDYQVLPRLIDVALGRPMEDLRARVAADLSGDVLEVGFGTGRNVPHYPSAVRKVYAVEPDNAGRKIAAKRIAASTVPVDYIGLDGQALPLDDESVDNVLVTWTLCTIPDAAQALGEVHRVLRPGGALHFVEHGRSPKPKVAEWQRRINPVWGRLFGGCRLDRRIPDMVADAGLQMARLETYPLKGAEFAGYMYEGVATKPR
jgi:ubiquinone/menaquinone biosynthesis C-methylase UbiE